MNDLDPKHVYLSKSRSAPLPGFQKYYVDRFIILSKLFQSTKIGPLCPVKKEVYILSTSFWRNKSGTVCPEFKIIQKSLPTKFNIQKISHVFCIRLLHYSFNVQTYSKRHENLTEAGIGKFHRKPHFLQRKIFTCYLYSLNRKRSFTGKRIVRRFNYFEPFKVFLYYFLCLHNILL